MQWVSGGVSTVQPFAQQKGFTMDYSLRCAVSIMLPCFALRS
jgi:hypothetical protein